MHMLNCSSLVIAVATPLATLLGILWAIYQYSKEATRKKRSETLAIYSTLFKETYNIREFYYEKTQEYSFSSDTIHADAMLYKRIMVLLTDFESFAKGLEYGIYDFGIFIYLTPKEMFEILDSFRQFIYDERNIKAYPLLFNDFIHLVEEMSLCIQKKINHQKFKKKYKKIKV